MLCWASAMRLSASAMAGAWKARTFSSASLRIFLACSSAAEILCIALISAWRWASATTLSANAFAASPASATICSARALASRTAWAMISAACSIGSRCTSSRILSTWAAAVTSASATILRASCSAAVILARASFSA